MPIKIKFKCAKNYHKCENYAMLKVITLYYVIFRVNVLLRPIKIIRYITSLKKIKVEKSKNRNISIELTFTAE